MSSLSATQADGYYLPAAYYDSGAVKKTSKNQWHQQQHGGPRGHNQFLQSATVRFELPYAGVCLSCKQWISKGTRYNAEKIATSESYFTTPIWEFATRCRSCTGDFVIRTDPEHCGFVYLKGLRKARDNETVVENNAEPLNDLERLEQTGVDERKSQHEVEQLATIARHNVRNLSDADGNARLRDAFRVERRARQRRRSEAAALGWRPGLSLVEDSIEDQAKAGSTVFGNGQQREQQAWSKVRSSRIFDSKQRRGRTNADEPRPDHVLPPKRRRRHEGIAIGDLTKADSPTAQKPTKRLQLSVSGVSAAKKASQVSALEALQAYGSESE